MIKVAIVDDHALFRYGLAKLLETESGIEVVWDAGAGREALNKCAENEPDVMLLDLDMPDIDGFEVTRKICESGMGTKVLILTMHDHEEYAIRLLQAGASGFMIKGSPPSELPAAIRLVFSGKKYIPQSLAANVADRLLNMDGKDPVSLLTDRELQVVIRVVKGDSILSISDELSLSGRTVETYKSRAMNKLGINSTGDLIRFAIRYGLVKSV